MKGYEAQEVQFIQVLILAVSQRRVSVKELNWIIPEGFSSFMMECISKTGSCNLGKPCLKQVSGGTDRGNWDDFDFRYCSVIPERTFAFNTASLF